MAVEGSAYPRFRQVAGGWGWEKCLRGMRPASPARCAVSRCTPSTRVCAWFWGKSLRTEGMQTNTASETGRMEGMTKVDAVTIEERLPAMAAVIHRVIPGSEVRLFGSRARGPVGPDSDIDLLITAPDSWLEKHHRFEVLNALWDQLSQADMSLDLLLYSQSECEARRHWRSHVIGRAYREGQLLHGSL